MDEDVKQRLQSSDLWMRALYMVFFAIVSVIVRAVITLLALVQFIAILFTGRANEPLLQLGNNLSTYVFQIVQFVTFNSESHPFPFSSWPDEAVEESPWTEDAAPVAPEPEDAPGAVDADESSGPTGPAGT